MRCKSESVSQGMRGLVRQGLHPVFTPTHLQKMSIQPSLIAQDQGVAVLLPDGESLRGVDRGATPLERRHQNTRPYTHIVLPRHLLLRRGVTRHSDFRWTGIELPGSLIVAAAPKAQRTGPGGTGTVLSAYLPGLQTLGFPVVESRRAAGTHPVIGIAVGVVQSLGTWPPAPNLGPHAGQG